MGGGSSKTTTLHEERLRKTAFEVLPTIELPKTKSRSTSLKTPVVSKPPTPLMPRSISALQLRSSVPSSTVTVDPVEKSRLYDDDEELEEILKFHEEDKSPTTSIKPLIHPALNMGISVKPEVRNMDNYWSVDLLNGMGITKPAPASDQKKSDDQASSNYWSYTVEEVVSANNSDSSLPGDVKPVTSLPLRINAKPKFDHNAFIATLQLEADSRGLRRK